MPRVHTFPTRAPAVTLGAIRTMAICAALWAGWPFAFAAPASGGTHAEPALAMRVSPSFAPAPAELRAVVTVAPRAGNRMVRVTLDSEQYFRSSDLTLEGEQAARHHTIQWRSVPTGAYLVTAQLFDESGEPGAHVSQTVDVIGNDLR